MRRQRPVPGGAATPGLRQGGAGLSAAEVEYLLARQGGACLICGRGSRGRTWTIDHDHELARLHAHPDSAACRHCVRGILCTTCNVGLGCFLDSPEVLRRAAAYVEESRRRGTRT